jgi:hypothetical protein
MTLEVTYQHRAYNFPKIDNNMVGSLRFEVEVILVSPNIGSGNDIQKETIYKYAVSVQVLFLENVT